VISEHRRIGGVAVPCDAHRECRYGVIECCWSLLLVSVPMVEIVGRYGVC
jgi:hypothetical protein